MSHTYYCRDCGNTDLVVPMHVPINQDPIVVERPTDLRIFAFCNECGEVKPAESMSEPNPD